MDATPEAAAALDQVLAEAAAGRRAVTGLAATLEAVAWGTVCRLFVDRDFHAEGSACRHCGVLQADIPAGCPLCGWPVEPVDLVAVMSEDVRRAGGNVEIMTGHAALSAGGGVAACVRYPVPRGKG